MVVQYREVNSLTNRIVALSLACVAALATVSVSNAVNSPLAVSMDQYLSASTKLGRFSGAVLVARNGTVLFRKAYGYADIESRAPFKPETEVEIASISKMFTAVAVLRLRDEGKLRLEGSVCDYLRECPDTWKPITIEEVLRHSSGIPDYEDALELGSEGYLAFMQAPDSTLRILENARKLPLDFKPGEKFKYSNTGYVVLGYIVQAVSGRPFAEFLTDQVLKPAGMSNSGVFGYGPAPSSLARGYTHGDIDWAQMLRGVSLPEEDLKAVPSLPLTPPHGDAGMYSTIDDLYRWSVAMDGGDFVAPSDSTEIFSAGPHGYGYGWIIGREYGERRYQHTGSLPGYVSALIKFPEEKLTIVVLSNLDRVRLNTISGTLSAIAMNKPYDLPVTGTVIKLTKDQQAALIGKYKLTDGNELSVEADGDSLSAGVEGKYLAGLISLSATTFYMPLSDGMVRFDLDASGKAKSVNLQYKGESHPGKRTVM